MNTAEAPSASNARQSLVLRATALVLFTGLLGILLPAQALEKFSWFMGYGQPRLDPLSVFMTADAACASVVLALVLWFLAHDPVRYQPLVRLLSWTFLITGLLWISLGMQCPLPWWWTSSAAAGCMGVGFLLRGSGDASNASRII